MKMVEFYVSKAVDIIVPAGDWLSEGHMDELYDMVSTVLVGLDTGLSVDDVVDIITDSESEDLHVIVGKDSSEDELVLDRQVPDNAPRLFTGDYFIFDEEFTDTLNDMDEYGTSPFEVGDEVVVEYVSVSLDRDDTFTRYKLDTYIVSDEPIRLEFSFAGSDRSITEVTNTNVRMEEPLGEVGTARV